jgi:thymidine phosphorylase
VNHAVGLLIHRKVGDHVEQEQPLFTIFADDETKLTECQNGVRTAFGWSDQFVPALPLFYS